MIRLRPDRLARQECLTRLKHEERQTHLDRLARQNCLARQNPLARLDRNHEAGNAPVEFIGVVIAVIIPVLMILAGVAQVQAARLAAESAASESARMYALSRDFGSAGETAQRTATLAFVDQGLSTSSSNPRIEVSCPRTCAGEMVTSRVRYTVKLPLLGWLPVARVSVNAVGTSYSGQYVERN
ncbi:hypothetical protein [Timonella senegalensis]|uniref:hypothetical protein n=1 Tax=Timonella senegalensis TaxID=1465825 RepID=UPI0002DD41F2|nr:hypothetical protein [Timonella senegalensis]